MEDTAEQEAGDPARVFEELKREVSAVWAEVVVTRRAMEALPDAWAENRPPDYTPELGRVTKGLAVVAAQLDAINQHPAFRMTPEQHRAAIAYAGDGLMREAARKLDDATRATERERQGLAELIGTARRQDEQRRQLVWSGGIAFAAALILGMMLSPYFVSAFFWGSWQTGVAATVMDADRWDAGEALMRAGNLDLWNGAINAWNLVRANQKEIAACSEEAVKTGKSQRCTIIVPALGHDGEHR